MKNAKVSSESTGSLDQGPVSSKSTKHSISKTDEYVPLSAVYALSVKPKRKRKHTTLDEIQNQILPISDEQSKILSSQSARSKNSKKQRLKSINSEQDSASILIVDVPNNKTRKYSKSSRNSTTKSCPDEPITTAKSDKNLDIEPNHDLSVQVQEKPENISSLKAGLRVIQDANTSSSHASNLNPQPDTQASQSAKKSKKNKSFALPDPESDVIVSNAPNRSSSSNVDLQPSQKLLADHISGATHHDMPSTSILPSDSIQDSNFDLGATWAADKVQTAKRRKSNTKQYSIETKKVKDLDLLGDSVVKGDDNIMGMNVNSSQWINISTAAETLEKQRKKRKREVHGRPTTEEDENTAPVPPSGISDQGLSHQVEKRIKKNKRDRKKLSELGVDSQRETGVDPKTLSSLASATDVDATIQKGNLSSKRPETSEEMSATHPHKKREKQLETNVGTTVIQPLMPEGDESQSKNPTDTTHRSKRAKKRSGDPEEPFMGTVADGQPANQSAEPEGRLIIDQPSRPSEAFKDPSSRKKSKKKRPPEPNSSSQTIPTQNDTAGQASNPEASADGKKLKRKSSTLNENDDGKQRKERRGAEESASSLANHGSKVVSEPALTDRPVSPVNQKWARDNPVLIDASDRNLIYQLKTFTDNMREALVGLTRDEILTMAWLRPDQLQELVDVFGFKYKKGTYSAKEKAIISSTIATYQKRNNLTDEGMRELILPTRVGVKIDKASEDSIFRELASKLPGRSLVSVWKTVTRAWELNREQGRWTKEEDQRLIDAVSQYGRSWVKVAPCVGRPPSNCLDRWRETVSLRATKKEGSWTQEEEDQLVMIMKRYMEKMNAQGELKYEGIWAQASVEMGGKRSPRQILSLKDKTLHSTPRQAWRHRDILILVQQLDKHEMEEDSGFDWKALSHEGWDRWPADHLRRRWKQIKKHYLCKHHDSTEYPSPSAPEIVRGILKIWSEKTEEELDRLVHRKTEVKKITVPEEKIKRRKTKSSKLKESVDETTPKEEIKKVDQGRLVGRKSEGKIMTTDREKSKKRKTKSCTSKEVIDEDSQEDEIKELDEDVSRKSEVQMITPVQEKRKTGKRKSYKSPEFVKNSQEHEITELDRDGLVSSKSEGKMITPAKEKRKKGQPTSYKSAKFVEDPKEDEIKESDQDRLVGSKIEGKLITPAKGKSKKGKSKSYKSPEFVEDSQEDENKE
ncbi:hypothetical protein DFH28DRAFT_1164380 [Melampsora americana]|nr:hypothetical protein DFH28DRAFT_1164380 [Melampsora americana]